MIKLSKSINVVVSNAGKLSKVNINLRLEGLIWEDNLMVRCDEL